MEPEQLLLLFHRAIGMVASLELATAAALDAMVENGVIGRDALVNALIERRGALDPKFSASGFDALIGGLTRSQAGPLQ